MRNKGFTLIELMIVIAIIAIIAAIAIPNLIEARKHGNEAAAIGALKTISTSQTLYREGDKDGDGTLDYGSLSELYTYNLIDQVLGSGSKQGFLFSVEPEASSIEYRWGGIADPALPGTTGDRTFAVNHSGVIYYTGNDDGSLNLAGNEQEMGQGDLITDSGLLPVGK
jgi:prepilin-type N-terminal cleavage/methylation domain-containing protein